MTTKYLGSNLQIKNARVYILEIFQSYIFANIITLVIGRFDHIYFVVIVMVYLLVGLIPGILLS
jgi:hypothetical protein